MKLTKDAFHTIFASKMDAPKLDEESVHGKSAHITKNTEKSPMDDLPPLSKTVNYDKDNESESSVFDAKYFSHSNTHYLLHAGATLINKQSYNFAAQE